MECENVVTSFLNVFTQRAVMAVSSGTPTVSWHILKHEKMGFDWDYLLPYGNFAKNPFGESVFSVNARAMDRPRQKSYRDTQVTEEYPFEKKKKNIRETEKQPFR